MLASSTYKTRFVHVHGPHRSSSPHFPAPQTPQSAQATPAPKPLTFEQAVIQKVRAGMKLKDAYRAVEGEHPGLAPATGAPASVAAVTRDETATDKWNALVLKHQGRGKTRGQAMREAARQDPKLHQRWLEEVNMLAALPPQTERDALESDPRAAPFLTAVLRAQCEGMSHGKAIQHVAKHRPELHEGYLHALRRSQHDG